MIEASGRSKDEEPLTLTLPHKGGGDQIGRERIGNPPPLRGREGCGVAVALWLALAAISPAQAQGLDDDDIERPNPPKLDKLDVDANGDGVPDGWYNLRDAKWVEGGVSGSKSRCFRFENARPGRPARASRAFGVDGRKVGAVVVGLWVRAERIGPGERLGDDPSLLIDFLGHELKIVRRGILGPWKDSIGPEWTRVVKRFSIPEGTRDAIVSLGLIGATGVLEVDDMAVELIPRDATPDPNLVVNGDFELGDPDPAGWIVTHDATRAFPGHASPAAVELARSGAQALTGVGASVEGLSSLRVGVAYRAKDLRGADAVRSAIFFLDDDARQIPGPAGIRPLFRWSGTSDWARDQAVVPVPPGATRAVIQFEKSHAAGTVLIDDVVVSASPQPDPSRWRAYHIETKKDGWLPVEPSKQIIDGSALDASGLLERPAGKHGFVTTKGGRLAFADGGRARFFGVHLLPPVPFQEPERADALADRLVRSGVNLVRLGDLDSAHGPGRSLFDDTREDTEALDPVALGRLDHLIAALKKRGIYVAIELQSSRRFRPEDDVPSVPLLPLGGGPGAIFDPKLRAALLKTADALLGHVNPETGLALKDDPVLAWVTLFGEVSLFDQLEDDDPLPPALAAALKARGGTGRSGWRVVEQASLKEIADALRGSGLKAPIAGVSHWRREADFSSAQQVAGLDLVDDRLYWSPAPYLAPTRRSLVWSRDGGLLAQSGKKRKPDRPYVIGQWCDQTSGAWAMPFEGADLMLATLTASAEDWDALVRRGVFIHPDPWGASATGTGGGGDIFQIPEAINAIPPVYALLPHAASLMLRDRPEPGRAAPRRGARTPAAALAGWDPRKGRLAIETPHTVALAGWSGGEPARSEAVTIEVDSDYAVVAASALGKEPLAEARRLLVTAVARVEPTGFAWVDEFHRDVADPGIPPLLREPVKGSVEWRRAGKVTAYALDADGKRTGTVPLSRTGEGVRLAIDGKGAGMHWELVADE